MDELVGYGKAFLTCIAIVVFGYVAVRFWSAALFRSYDEYQRRAYATRMLALRDTQPTND